MQLALLSALAQAAALPDVAASAVGFPVVIAQGTLFSANGSTLYATGTNLYTLADTAQVTDAEVCEFFQVWRPSETLLSPFSCLGQPDHQVRRCCPAIMRPWCGRLRSLMAMEVRPDPSRSSTSPATRVSKLTAVARMLGIGRLGGLPVDATPVPIQACSSISSLKCLCNDYSVKLQQQQPLPQLGCCRACSLRSASLTSSRCGAWISSWHKRACAASVSSWSCPISGLAPALQLARSWEAQLARSL